MAEIRILIDTDIVIDSLKGIKAAKELFRTEGVDLYCSILTRKELLSKVGLKNSERKRIINLLAKMKILRIDDDIKNKFKATAWSKRLPLLTRNKKHFGHIKEIKLSPGYEIE
jgi:predicted nucleic acid-binding protein